MDEISRRHVAEIPFPLSFNELSAAAESFLQFLLLPQEVKNSFTPPNAPERSYSIPGYRLRRKGVENARDNKEFFHYHPGYESHVSSLPEANNPRAQQFLTHARIVNVAATATLRSIVEMLDVEFPGVFAEYFPDTTEPVTNTILRFLKYDKAGEGSFLAAAHYDVGGATLALAESAPGLRVGVSPETLYPVIHRSGAALFMPALDLQTMTDERFKPIWHDVVQLSEDTHSDTTSRWAIVFFANAISKKSVPVSRQVACQKVESCYCGTAISHRISKNFL